MNIGGIEKSLTTLLSEFDKENNEILLVLHDSDGAFFKNLPEKNIQVFYTKNLIASQFLKDDIRHFRLIEVIKGLWNRLMLRIDKDWYAQIMYTYRIMKRGLVFPGHFDCAIAFSTDYSDMAMVLTSNADKKAAFIHGDATFHPYSAKLNDHLVNQLDRIFSVSYQAREKFISVHPKCAGKVDIIHNLILSDDIREKANEPPTDMIMDDTLTLCTVARMVPDKGQYMIPEIAEMLCKTGIKFRWYLIGDGNDRPRVEAEIISHNMQNYVFLLGSRLNPYPYIKNCDIYVQTSFHEAFCLTVAEARTLCKPIVTTAATGIREQFEGNDGLIVEAMTPEALYNGIKCLIDNVDLQNIFVQNLKKFHDNVNDLPKLYDYIME